MFWNHRIIQLTEPDLDGEPMYVFAEVFYHDETRKPYAWHEPFNSENHLEDMRHFAERLLLACDQPVLMQSDIDPPVAAPEHLLPWIALNHWHGTTIITESTVDEAIYTMRDC